MSQILVIDDEPAIGWSLKELLSDEGHEVALAADIPAAVEAAGRARPDAVLLDVRLGGSDGIVALPELRTVIGGVPVRIVRSTALVLASRQARVPRRQIQSRQE